MTIKVTPTAPLPAPLPIKPVAAAPVAEPAAPKGQPRLDADLANVRAAEGGVAEVELGALTLPVAAVPTERGSHASLQPMLTEDASPAAAEALTVEPYVSPILAEDGGATRTSGGAGGRRA